MQRPFLQFYTRDWRSDTRLRACSFAARGLWIEMMAIMHEAAYCGVLAVGNDRLTERNLAAIAIQTGAPGGAAEVRKLLAELKRNGVYSIADDGAIYSRRMVRDEEKRVRNRENGRRGGNPALKPSDNPENAASSDNPEDKAHAGAITGARSRRADTHDRVPETRDQRPETAAPSPAGAREMRPVTEPFGLADWIWGLAFERGLIGEHRAPKRNAEVLEQLKAAKELLAAYPVEEIQARARRLLDAIVSGELKKIAMSAAGLAKAWDYSCVAPPRTPVRAGAAPTKFLDVDALE